jgi:hypothetical protein
MKESKPTLILSISTLNFLVFALLDLSFQHSGALGFVKASDFEYLRRVEP